MSKSAWTGCDIADQEGKLIVITGANSGIGLQAAKVLASKKAEVVMAVRNVERGERAAEEIRRHIPEAKLFVMPLDLSNLSSVRLFAESLQERHNRLSVLINNAGIMAIPYHTSADGYEMQFATNHLGHCALTGLLLPVIGKTPNARVITTSSTYHRRGKIDFDNLDGSKGYHVWKAYRQSKLANLLFAWELQRRFELKGINAISIGTHPGYTRTNLHLSGANMRGSRIGGIFARLASSVLAQCVEIGVLPTLYAATSQDVRGGDYIGPGGLFELRGYPGNASASKRSKDIELAQRLWRISEEMTCVKYL